MAIDKNTVYFKKLGQRSLNVFAINI
jgi:hypothetical protein